MRSPGLLTVAIPLVGGSVLWAAVPVAPGAEVMPFPGGNGCAVIIRQPKPVLYSQPCRDVARYLREELHVAEGSGVVLLLDGSVPASDVTALTTQLSGAGYRPMPTQIELTAPNPPSARAIVPPKVNPHMAIPPPEVDRHMAVPPPDVDRGISVTPAAAGR